MELENFEWIVSESDHFTFIWVIGYKIAFNVTEMFSVSKFKNVISHKFAQTSCSVIK